MRKEDYYHWLKLVSIEGLGAGKLQRLLKIFHSPQEVFEADRKMLSDLQFLSEPLVDKILQPQNEEFVHNQLELLDRYEVRLISIHDEEYPDLLKFTYNPPILLYIKGEILPEDNRSLAIVGTRKPTSYGKMVVEVIARELARSGFTIVSGLAYGIDKYSHQAALAAGGRTIAVCGTGLDTVYPPSHRRLAQEIIQNGALISEFPLKSKIEPWNFPTRNRIISGMSKGTLVIEGKKTSGALLTAKIALDQNRDVFAVPGNINSPQSEGPNMLIKQGAKLVTKVEDVLEEYRVELEIAGEQSEKQSKRQENKKEFVPKMTNEESEIYRLLQDNQKNLTLDKMVQLTRFSAAELSVILLNMELKGIIRREAQNRYWLM
ncbi:MAG: DNA-processing protein DprA [Candidatus Cloacimonadia bacterium]